MTVCGEPVEFNSENFGFVGPSPPVIQPDGTLRFDISGWSWGMAGYQHSFLGTDDVTVRLSYTDLTYTGTGYSKFQVGFLSNVNGQILKLERGYADPETGHYEAWWHPTYSPNAPAVFISETSGTVIIEKSGSDFRFSVEGLPEAVWLFEDVDLGSHFRLEMDCGRGEGYGEIGVTVTDLDIEVPEPNQPPDCSEAIADPAVIWPPDGDFTEIGIAGVVDPDGDAMAIEITEITDDESDDGSDHGVLGGSTTSVRAERDGKGDGRTYTISFDASDGQATSSGTVTVSVPHDRGKGNAKGRLKKPTVAGYSNPTYATTSIRYTLPEAAQVRLAIYNPLGQEVRVLVQGGRAAGLHTVVWDGRDALGRKVSRGVYLSRLVAGANVAVRKVILTK